jgi:hypothetical protein
LAAAGVSDIRSPIFESFASIIVCLIDTSWTADRTSSSIPWSWNAKTYIPTADAKTAPLAKDLNLEITEHFLMGEVRFADGLAAAASVTADLNSRPALYIPLEYIFD